MNSVANVLPSGGSPSPTAPAPQSPKVAPSDFDKVSKKQGSVADASDPSTESHSAATPAPPQVQQALATTHADLSRLKDKVAATSGTDGMSGLQKRLVSLEHQYAQITQSANHMPAGANEQQVLALQQRIYSMSESISALSKMVSQTTTGVKTMLQAQV